MLALKPRVGRRRSAGNWRPEWSGRGAKGRPIPGNSPNDRQLRGPGCNRPKRVCADASPPTRSPQSIPMAIRMRFLRALRNLPVRYGVLLSTQTRAGASPPANGSHPGPRTRREDRALLIVQMSSDRLFLDRVARQHCPSPLHRHTQHNSIAGSNGTIYHRTVTSVLTGCLTPGVHFKRCLTHPVAPNRPDLRSIHLHLTRAVRANAQTFTTTSLPRPRPATNCEPSPCRYRWRSDRRESCEPRLRVVPHAPLLRAPRTFSTHGNA
jgi:hypothetical protein